MKTLMVVLLSIAMALNPLPARAMAEEAGIEVVGQSVDYDRGDESIVLDGSSDGGGGMSTDYGSDDISVLGQDVIQQDDQSTYDQLQVVGSSDGDTSVSSGAGVTNTQKTFKFEGSDVRVTAELADPAVLPAGVRFVVKNVTPTTDDYNYDAYLAALNDSVQDKDPYNDKNTLLYDVSFIAKDDAGNDYEVEPADGSVKVTFDFKKDQLNKEIDVDKKEDVNVAHLPEEDGKVVVEDVDAKVKTDKQIEMTVDSLSVYAVYYTVDYTYDGYTYHMPGGTNMLLSDLFSKLGIDEDVKFVQDVTFTNPELLQVDKDGDDWKLTSLQAFTSEETLTVTLASGATVIIDVSDEADADIVIEPFNGVSDNWYLLLSFERDNTKYYRLSDNYIDWQNGDSFNLNDCTDFYRADQYQSYPPSNTPNTYNGEDITVQLIDSSAHSLGWRWTSNELLTHIKSSGDLIGTDDQGAFLNIDNSDGTTSVSLIPPADFKINVTTNGRLGNSQYYILASMEDGDNTRYWLSSPLNRQANSEEFSIAAFKDETGQNEYLRPDGKSVKVQVVKSSRSDLDIPGALSDASTRYSNGQIVNGGAYIVVNNTDANSAAVSFEQKDNTGERQRVKVEYYDYDKTTKITPANDELVDRDNTYVLAYLTPKGSGSQGDLIAYALEQVRFNGPHPDNAYNVEFDQFTCCDSDGNDTTETIRFNRDRYDITYRLYHKNGVITDYNDCITNGRDIFYWIGDDHCVRGFDFLRNETQGNETRLELYRAFDTIYRVKVTFDPVGTTIDASDNYFVFVDSTHENTESTYYLEHLTSANQNELYFIVDGKDNGNYVNHWKKNDGTPAGERFSSNWETRACIVKSNSSNPFMSNVIASSNGTSQLPDGSMVKDYIVTYKPIDEGVEDTELGAVVYTSEIVFDKIETSNDYDFRSILGPAVKYGITAEFFSKENHIQTNFAANHYKGNDSDVRPDLAGSTGSIVIGEFNLRDDSQHNRVGEKAYTRTEGSVFVGKQGDQLPGTLLIYADKNSGYSDEKVWGNGSDQAILIETDGEVLSQDIVEPCIEYMKAISSELASHEATFDPPLPSSGNLYIDTTMFPNDATIYLDADRLTNYLSVTGALNINKLDDQVIVFNFKETDSVIINKYLVRCPSLGESYVDTSTPSESNTEKNNKLDNICRHIVWNCNSCSYVKINDSSGLYLQPNDNSEVYIDTTSGGWIVSDGFVHNPGGEWHFFYRDLPDANIIDLQARKTIDGEIPSADQKFNFTLTRYAFNAESSGYEWRTLRSDVNNNGTTVDFDNVNDFEEGWSLYRITESADIPESTLATGAYTTDDTEIYALVRCRYINRGQPNEQLIIEYPRYFKTFDASKFTSDGDVDPVISESNPDGFVGDKVTRPTFKNETKDASISIEAEKVLRFGALEDGAFQFKLTEVDDQGEPLSDAYSETVSNAADGTIKFSKITYDSAGTHYYKVEEVIPEPGIEGMTYDTQSHILTVEVSQDEGELIASCDDDLVTFTNSMPAPQPVETLTASKSINVVAGDNKVLTDNQFEFSASLKEGNAADVDLSSFNGTAKNNASGEIDFGQIKFLKSGTYTFEVKETGESPAGYAKDNSVYIVIYVVNEDMRVTKTIEKGDEHPTDIAFVNDYTAQPVTVTFSGTKTLLNSENTEVAVAANQFSFSTASGSNNPEDGANLTSFNNPAKNDANGNIIFGTISFTKTGTYTYTISEDEVDESARISKDGTAYTVTVTVSDNGSGQLTASVKVGENGSSSTAAEGLNFQNRELPSLKTQISGTKTWVGDPAGTTHNNREELQLVLKRQTSAMSEPETVEGAVPTWSDDTYTFSELDIEDANHNAYTYSVDENPLTAYNSSKSGNNFTNTRKTVDVSVTKVWKDADRTPATRPQFDDYARYLKLVVDGDVNDSLLPTSISPTDDVNVWTAVWQNLPEYVGDHKVSYQVLELPVPNYICDKSGEQDPGSTFTNRLIGMKQMTGTKTWLDGGKPHDSSQEVTLVLQRKTRSSNWEAVTYVKATDIASNQNDAGGPDSGADQGGSDDQGGASDQDDESDQGGSVAQGPVLNWDGDTYTFSELPKYDSEGYEYTYSVSEKPKDGYEIIPDGNNFTNHSTAETSVSVEKVWDDADNQDGKRPTSVTVHLMADGEQKGDPVVLDEVNGWTKKWDKLEKYSSTDGHEIAYTVTEEAVPNYSTSIEQVTEQSAEQGDQSTGQSAEHAFVVTNSYTPKETSVTVTKKWVDGNNKEQTRGNVTVALLADGTAVDGKTIELTEANNWAYTWSELPMKAAGKDIVYTVNEVSGPAGYGAGVITGNATEGFTITNTLTGTTEVSGTKTWVDGDEQHENDKDVTLVLTQTSAKPGSEPTEHTQAPVWTGDDFVYSNLPLYDAEGYKYTYTVDEAPKSGYTTTRKDNDFTNTRTGTTEVTGTKTWIDGGKDHDNSKDVKLTLKRQSAQPNVAEETLTNKPEWTGNTYAFAELPAYDAEGYAYTYSVTETNITGYDTQQTGNDFTNKLVGTVDVSGTKTWVDGSVTSHDNAALVQLKLTQTSANPGSAPQVLEDKTPTWTGDTYTYANLPKYDDEGYEYTYTVDELPTTGYGTEQDGLNFTNTRTGKVTISGTKSWIGTDGQSEAGHDNLAEVKLELRRSSAKDNAVTTVDDASCGWTGDTYTFANLPAFDDEGYAYTYTVVETPIVGYDTTYNGNNITNTRKTTEVEGAKIWADDDNAAGKRADITVQLQKRTGAGNWTDIEGKTATIAADATGDALNYSFTDLPEYEDGVKVEYRVVETNVPEGYTVSGGTDAESFDLTNTIKGKQESELPVKLTVRKTDADGAKLKGAVFTLTDADNATSKGYTTGDDGTVTITFAEPGTWKLQETQAPAGYVLSDTVYNIEVTRSGDAQITYDQGNAIWNWVYNLGFVNGKPQLNEAGELVVTDTKTSVTINKTDITGDEELPDAELSILDSTGTVAKDLEGNDCTWTSEIGKTWTVSGLQPGTYTLHETVAPEGYAIASDTSFTIDEYGKVTTTGTMTEDGVILVKDSKTSVSVSKVAVGGGSELAGAQIQLMDAKSESIVKINNVEVKWTSEEGKTHEIEGLQPGTYVLRETVAPAGYSVATDITFTLDAYGNITTEAATSDGAILIEDALTKLTISKTDIASGDELDDAKLEIRDANGIVKLGDTELTHTSKAGEPWVIEGLKPGSYTLVETTAPDGYAIADSTSFTIDEQGTITVTGKSTTDEDGNVVILVEDAKTSVTISKRDITAGDDELPGATLQIFEVGDNDARTPAKIDGKLVKWVSSEDGPQTIEGLTAGKDYVLVETTAPDGYTIAAETFFTIAEDGTVTTTGSTTTDGIILVNDAPTSVSISKWDVTNAKELADAHIQILDESGAVATDLAGKPVEWDSTDEAHEVIGLKTGVVYTLHETSAPDGYTIAADTKFQIETDGTITLISGTSATGANGETVLLVEDAQTVVKVSKADIVGGAELAGAEIVLTDADGVEKDRWISAVDDETTVQNEAIHEIIGLNTGVEYTLSETVAPDGYAITTDTTFIIDETGKITVTGSRVQDGVILIEDALTTFTVSKKAVAGSAELPGAELQIMAADGSAVSKLRDGSEAKWISTTEPHKVEGLKAGDYILRETVAPNGYKVATDIAFTLEADGSITRRGESVSNNQLLVEDALTQVKVSKKAITGGSELPGATLSVFRKDATTGIETLVDSWTSGSAPYTLDGLWAGETYILRETVAPEGYAITSEIAFTLDKDGKVTTTDAPVTTGTDGVSTILVADAKTSVTVSKTNITGDEELAGARIELFDADGNPATAGGKTVAWTSNGTPHEIEGLVPGTYTLRETVAPDGYTIATDTTFTLAADGTVTVSGQTCEDGHILIKDELTKVSVSKVDIANGEELEGATIQIIDSKGKVVEEWTSTDKPHEIEGLKTGEEYTLRETVAPEGYTIATDTTFTIGTDGKVTTTGTMTEEGILLVEDAKTHIAVSKVDIAGGEELEGAHIQIIDSEGTIVEEWDSTDEAYEIEGLKTGEEYTLRETVAPEGYTIATDTKFTIDEKGNVTSTGSVTEDGILLVEDAKTSVKVSKTDIASGKEIAGATIQIIDSEGKVIEGWVSTDKPYEITGLKTGEEYTLRETVAPEGYGIATDTTFTIGTDGKVTTTGTVTEDGILLVEDAMTSVSISKWDVAGKTEVAGAHIQIITVDDEHRETIVEQWDSTDVAHKVTGLLTGVRYILRETVAPDGFAVTDDTYFQLKADGTVDTDKTSTTINAQGVLLVEDAPTSIKVSKVATGAGTELAGAHIQLLDELGNVVDEWDSKADDARTLDVNEGIHEVTHITGGALYTLRETVAPDGYTVCTDTTFFLSKDGTIDTDNTTTRVSDAGVLLVEDDLTKVSVSKVDIADSAELEGATIQIIDSKGDIVDEWVSTDKPYEITGLKTGEEYTLRETVAPEGYTIATDTKFTIDEKGNVTSTGSVTEDGILLVEDAKTSVKVSKVDIADGEEIAGATIQIIDSTGKVVEGWVSTDKPYEITGLKTGEEYTLRETVAPEGYGIATDTTFTIGTDGKVTTTGSVTEDGILLVEDAKTSVSISKWDVAGKQEVAGAHIQIITVDDEHRETIVEQWDSTDVAHKVTGLVTGVKYILRETVAPDGYTVTTDTTFFLSKDGTIDTDNTTTRVSDAGVLLVEDDLTKISVSKVDIANGEELEGATIQIIEKATGKEFTKWVSGDDGKDADGKINPHTIEGLKTGTEYILRETVAPEGYTIATDTTFTIDENGNVTSTGSVTENGILLVEDAKTRVTIDLVDSSNNEEIAGGKIQVISKDGELIEEWTPGENESHTIEGLPTDEEFIVYLVKAPDGYYDENYGKEKTELASFKIDTNGTVDYSGDTKEGKNGEDTLLVKATPTKVSIEKVVKDTSQLIKGSHIQVWDSQGVLVEEWDSSNEGPYTINNLKVGELYKIVETIPGEGYSKSAVSTFKINEDGSVEFSGKKDKDGNLVIEGEKLSVQPTKKGEESTKSSSTSTSSERTTTPTTSSSIANRTPLSQTSDPFAATSGLALAFAAAGSGLAAVGATIRRRRERDDK